MGNLGAEKAKNQGLGWQQGCGGGALVKAPEEKRGEMGENGGKWGEMGENGEEMGRKWGERGAVAPPKFPPFSPIFPHFPPFSPIFPHFPPFSPIFPHFPPFFLAMGTLWVRLWVQYPPPEPGTSDPCIWNSAAHIHTFSHDVGHTSFCLPCYSQPSAPRSRPLGLG